MKNIISKILVAVALMVGVQSLSAQSLKQDQDRPEVMAKTTVNELSEVLNLTGDQQRTLFRAYVSKYSNYKKHIDGKDMANSEVISNKKKFDQTFEENVKSTLKPEQYKKWLTLQKQ